MPKPGEEDEIIIRSAALDERLLKLIQALKTEEKLTGYAEDRIVKLQPKDIYYFEAVDNHIFAYTAKEAYEVHKKLFELEQE